MKVSELSGAMLDYWVARAEGMQPRIFLGKTCHLIDDKGRNMILPYSPSADWASGGPIIEREGIATYRNYIRDGSGRFNGWIAAVGSPAAIGNGETPLIAAMRCFVRSKFGDEVLDGSA